MLRRRRQAVLVRVRFFHVHATGFIIVDFAFFTLQVEICCAIDECGHMCARDVVVWVVVAAGRCCCDADFGECCDVAVDLVDFADVLELDEVVVVHDDVSSRVRALWPFVHG